MADGPSADRTAELLLRFHREPSRYLAEGRRRDAPHLESDVVLKLALGRPVNFVDAALNDARMTISLKQAAEAYVRNVYFHPDATPYQTLGLSPGASQEAIRERFRQLMHLVHPDRQGDRKLWPDACAAQANRAYAILRDPDARDRLEREAEARAALARAIHRAAASAEASHMPVPTWLKSNRRPQPLLRPVLPEWLTAGFGGYARRNPTVIAFAALGLGAVLVIAATSWNAKEGLLVRDARDTYATEATPVPEPRVSAPAPVVTAQAFGHGPALTPGPRTENVALTAPMVPPPSPSVPVGVAMRPTPEPRTEVAKTASPPVAEILAAQASDPAAAASVARVEPVAVVPAPRAEAPVAISVQSAAVSAASPSAPATAEIEALFASFVESYERGRLDAFAALFDEEADTNLRRGRSSIRDEYDELFRLSQWRRMQLTRINWRHSGDRAIAKGEITVKIGWRDGREVEQRFNLDMELMRRDGRLVIARMTHQPTTP
jgi:ketosteroid isomerase-like protein